MGHSAPMRDDAKTTLVAAAKEVGLFGKARLLNGKVVIESFSRTRSFASAALRHGHVCIVYRVYKRRTRSMGGEGVARESIIERAS